MTSKALAAAISNLALEKKGKRIMMMDISGITSFADFFVIITGDSKIHLKAIADHIEKELKKKKIKMYHK
jgi:ribosome-associated protein